MQTRKTIALFLIAVLLPVFETSCSGLHHFTKKKVLPASVPEDLAEPVHTKVGKIVLVNQEENFVLIEGETGFAPKAGSFLTSKNEDGTWSLLRIGSEYKRPFLIGEIQDNIPVVGAEVFQ